MNSIQPLILIIAILFSAYQITYSQYTNIPDTNFEQTLIDQGIDTEGTLDGQILTVDANNKTGLLSVGNQNIADLSGISAFTSITSLDCRSNPLTILDVTALNQLTAIDCRFTMITSIDLTGLSVLENFICFQSDFTSITFGTHPVLTSVSLSGNDFVGLDLTGLQALETVYAASCNLLTSLDVSGLSNLEILSISGNSQMSVLNISGCNALINLYCNQGDLASLDLTGLTLLEELSCYDNNISTLTFGSHPVLNYINCAQNDFASLDVSGFSALEELWCYNAPILTSINASSLPNLTLLLITGNPMLISLNVTGSTSLIEINCNGGALNSLDLTGQTSLEKLNIQYCNLSSINLDDCGQLLQLYAGWNDLTAIDITNNQLLENIDLRLNNISSIETAQLLQLKTLNMNSNDLVFLDLSASPLLIYVNVQNNDLISLNVKNGNNLNFTGFVSVFNLGLTCIEVDDPAWSTVNWTNVDGSSSFETSCPGFCTSLTYPLDGSDDGNPGNGIGWTALPSADGYKLKIGTCSGCTDIADNLDVGNVSNYNPGNFDAELTYYVTITPYIGVTDGQGCIEESFSFENGVVNFTGYVEDINGNFLWSTMLIYDAESLELETSIGTTLGQGLFDIDISPGIYNVWVTNVQESATTEVFSLDLTGNVNTTIVLPPNDDPGYMDGLGATKWNNIAVYGDGTDPNFITVKTMNSFNIDSMFMGIALIGSGYLEGINEDGVQYGKYKLMDDGLGNDAIAGDGIFTSSSLLFDIEGFYYRNDAISHYSAVHYEIYENGVSNWIRYGGGLQIGFVNPNTVAHDPLVQISDSFFINNHIINLTYKYGCIKNKIYEIYLDTFDFINRHQTEINLNANQHITLKNEILGIGTPIFGGVQDKLLGISDFPGAHSAPPINHETIHQWANGMETLFPSAIGNPGHYGSTSVYGVLGGIGPTVTIIDGNTVNFSSYSSGGVQGNYRSFADLELYAMGVLDITELRPEYIVVTDPVYTGNDNWDVSSITTVTPQDILDEYGPRIPAPDLNVPEFRTATLVCSHEPLNAASIDFYTYQARAWEGSITDPLLSFHECADMKADMITELPAAKYGCTDPTAHNYVAYADVDDGSCETCTDDILNGDETSIDCGGDFCDLCTVLGGDCPNILVLNTETIITGLYKAENEVSSTNVVNPNLDIEFSAGLNVDLEPGFYLPKTTNFEAVIKNCIPD